VYGGYTKGPDGLFYFHVDKARGFVRGYNLTGGRWLALGRPAKPHGTKQSAAAAGKERATAAAAADEGGACVVVVELASAGAGAKGKERALMAAV
jgi:hypothetical protein